MSHGSDATDVPVKPLRWIGSSLDDLRGLPGPVRSEFGYALYFAQIGDKYPKAKPMKGFAGASVLEIVDDHDGDTYRAVYTVRFQEAVYVLHVFQKKARRGIATPSKELALVQRRLALAEARHRQELQSDD
jgi:phage-related protein